MTAGMTLFSQHGLVDLVLQNNDRRAARVTAVGQRHILLTSFAGPAEAPVGPDFTAAALEGVGPQGVSRVEGAVASVVSVAERQALTFKPADPSVLRQRRSDPRVALDRGVLLTRIEGSDAPVAGRVLDLSAGGMRFSSAASFAVGEQVFVTFDAPDVSRPLSAAGCVARVEPDGDCAVVFTEGRDAHRVWVDRLIRSARVQS
jgi:hypothetical protein